MFPDTLKDSMGMLIFPIQTMTEIHTSLRDISLYAHLQTNLQVVQYIWFFLIGLIRGKNNKSVRPSSEFTQVYRHSSFSRILGNMQFHFYNNNSEWILQFSSLAVISTKYEECLWICKVSGYNSCSEEQQSRYQIN